MIYPVSFVASSLFLNLGSITERRIKKWILFSISTIIPIIVASLRADTVGIDVRVYVRPYANYALYSKDLIQYLRVMMANSVEIGYSLVNFLGMKVFGSITGVFMLCSIIVIVPAYLRFLDYDEYPKWLLAFIFLCLFYTLSLNLVRQAMAISVIFWGYRYVENKEYNKFLWIVVIATSFHITGLIGIALYIINVVSLGENWAFKQIISIFILVICVINYNSFLVMTARFLFRGNADKYINAFFESNTGYLSTWNMLFNIFLIAAVLFNKKRLVNIGKYKSYYLIAIFNFLLYLLTIYNGNCFRYSLFFRAFSPVIVPGVRVRFTDKSRKIVDVVIAIVYLLYWYNFNVVTDSFGVLPYLTRSELG